MVRDDASHLLPAYAKATADTPDKLDCGRHSSKSDGGTMSGAEADTASQTTIISTDQNLLQDQDLSDEAPEQSLEPTQAEKLANAASILFAKQLSGEEEWASLDQTTTTPQQKTHRPLSSRKTHAVTPNADPRDEKLAAMIRSEVNAANREWVAQLVQGVQQYLGDEKPLDETLSLSKGLRADQSSPSASSPTAHPEEGLRPVSKGLDSPAEKKFAQFAFGDANHAYIAGADGLFQVQLKAVAAQGDDNGGEEEEADRVGATAPGRKVVLTQLGAETITLNGAANQKSPIKENILQLKLYGTDKLPAVVVADAEDADEPINSIKIFAALDTGGTAFATNTNGGDADRLYDATQKLDAAGKGNTEPDAKFINQPIVALAASPTQNRFFVAVADGGGVTRKLYKRPDDADDIIRQAVIDGMGSVKKTTGKAFTAGSTAEKAIQAVTPDNQGVAGAKENYTQAVMSSVNNALFLKGLDADATIAAANVDYANLLFRDAINLRKGGLLDTAWLAAGSPATIKPPAILGEIQFVVAAAPAPPNTSSITEQVNPNANPLPVFKANTSSPQGALAAAIQVALGRGVRELAAATTAGDVFKEPDTTKPFTSLDSRRFKDDKDAITDLNIFVADQDGLARGVCVAKLDNTQLITQQGAPAKFLVNPGKIVTTAMYDGIALNDKNALAPGFGQLKQVGIPCAVYSAADAYPATRAMISGDVEMVWDEPLQRLFVGFSDISLGDDTGYLTNGSGGVCSVMVGQEKQVIAGGDQALYFQPIIGPNFQSLLFQDFLTPDAKIPPTFAAPNTAPTALPTDYIAAFYQKHNPAKLNAARAITEPSDLHASAKKLRVMHTSTGKDYLVFNGGVAKQQALTGLNSKVYALPLVGGVVAEAGLIAGAKRPAGADFYSKGLDGVNFDKVVGDGLTTLQQQVGGFAKNLLGDWGRHHGVNESRAIFNAIKDSPIILSGLATTALQSCYAKTDDGTVPATTDDAATIAFNRLNTGDPKTINNRGYNFDDKHVGDIQKNQLIERIEELGLDAAAALAAARAAHRAKTQAPTYDVARYINLDKMKTAADNGRNDEGAVFVAGVAAAAYAKSFGPAGNIDIAAGKIGAVDAGGIAGGVAAIEGGLGWSIKNIFDAANNLHTAKLIPAVATMHADANNGTYPAFDYVRVGNNPQRLSSDTTAMVQDSWVVGDTVYVSLGDQPNKEHTRDGGVFASTAIFHSDGFVRSWTPWRRVLGNNKPVAGVALDHTTSRYWTTTKNDGSVIDPSPSVSDLDTVRVTEWGKGYRADAATDGRLSTALEGVFGDIGGIFGLYAFGPETQGLKERDPLSPTPANRHEQFSLTVATGNGRVALIKTGKFDTSSGTFKPTTKYNATAADGKNSADTNVFVFDANSPENRGKALGQLGIITCAELSRLPLAGGLENRRGWLFVGGTGGLAVLTRWFNGKGWNTGLGEGLSDMLPGSQRDDFPGGSGWRFMQIKIKNGANVTNPFTDVRKIVSDGSKYLYVMTPTEIWRIDMLAVLPAGAVPPRTPRNYGIFKREENPRGVGVVARTDIEYVIELSNATVVHTVATTDTAQVDPTPAATAAAAAIAGVTVAQSVNNASVAAVAAGASPAVIAAATVAGNKALTAVQAIADFAAAITAAHDPIFNTADKQFLDMMVGYRDGATPATQVVIGTTAGLFYNNFNAVAANNKQFDDAVIAGKDIWTQLKTVNEPGAVQTPLSGPVMRLEFTSSQAGDRMKAALDPANLAKTYADGNLLVTALDPAKKYVATYRFNLSADDWVAPTKLTIAPFNEPYHVSGDATATTPYFYKVGTLNTGDGDKIEFSGPFDYFARAAHTAGSAEGFAEGVFMLPEPTSFERDKATDNYEDIDLGLDLTLPLYFGNLQLEPATGAQVVSGEFGLRVND